MLQEESTAEKHIAKILIQAFEKEEKRRHGENNKNNNDNVNAADSKQSLMMTHPVFQRSVLSFWREVLHGIMGDAESQDGKSLIFYWFLPFFSPEFSNNKNNNTDNSLDKMLQGEVFNNEEGDNFTERILHRLLRTQWGENESKCYSLLEMFKTLNRKNETVVEEGEEEDYEDEREMLDSSIAFLQHPHHQRHHQQKHNNNENLSTTPVNSARRKPSFLRSSYNSLSVNDFVSMQQQQQQQQNQNQQRHQFLHRQRLSTGSINDNHNNNTNLNASSPTPSGLSNSSAGSAGGVESNDVHSRHHSAQSAGGVWSRNSLPEGISITNFENFAETPTNSRKKI